MTDTDATGTQTIGFRTLADEVTRDDLPIEGRLPGWLTGELVRVLRLTRPARGASPNARLVSWVQGGPLGAGRWCPGRDSNPRPSD